MEINNDEFYEIINSSEKLVIVDFFAEWCMPCLMLAPVIEELAERMENVKFVKVNTEDNEELAERIGVSSIPCLVFFKDGKEVNRVIGNQTGDFIERKIKDFL